MPNSFVSVPPGKGEDERRVHRRYPVNQRCRWWTTSLWQREAQYTGEGETRDISSGGLLVVCAGNAVPPRVGLHVEVSVEWPALLGEPFPLQLRIWGVVARQDGDRFAAQIERYEFCTRGTADTGGSAPKTAGRVNPHPRLHPPHRRGPAQRQP